MFIKIRYCLTLLFLILLGCTKEASVLNQSNPETSFQSLNSELTGNINIYQSWEGDSFLVRNGGNSRIIYKFFVENDPCYFTHVLFFIEKDSESVLIKNPKLYIDNELVLSTSTVSNDSITIVARVPAKIKYDPGEHLLTLKFISFGDSGANYRINLLDNNLKFVNRNRSFVEISNTPIIGPAMIFR